VSTVARAFRPFGIVSIDTCMTQDLAVALALAPVETRVAVYWQTLSWLRPFDEFRAAYELGREPRAAARDTLEELSALGVDAHNAIVPEALSRVLAALTPAP
jgi:hypothetical protein